MLGLIQIVLSIVLTVIFGINNAIAFTFFGVSKVILFFLICNIVITFIFLFLFVIFVYTTEKIDYRKLWKHKIANLISMYGFRFYNRVRLVTTGQENLPKDRNFVVYSNHIEYTDPIFIMQVYKKHPLAFIGKEPLFKIIGLKNLLHGLGNLPLNKHANKSALETIIQAIKQVKGGMPM
ncbi:MAG: 1-acyl-sn-glycerol-3-phosphate acyltransferase, partial [Tenericutes bacterium]|nr:1-acyl-sn-glycerol-3-phosphate acyltransferase [Mycoplasmatota bacterium]